ncbi:hypothetical protein K461DRAFT_291923 [Myriangium duriaei CBS 260.36]|uniref:Uncharacterized protein n=1 Tax=Myriangium duriaei CBS 260.36 TaxID=1168546 RepID=A0A9P4MHP8_9PEZI|nr:hypothetical protein K461DRAFT_291923 [Myriangium duriaei CBS 260.36]
MCLLPPQPTHPKLTSRHQLLDLVLARLETFTLFNLSPLSRKLHRHVLVALHSRLSAAAALENHTLVLECYHPAARLSTTNLYCTNLGTPGLDSALDVTPDGEVGRLQALGDLYTRFLPQHQEPQRASPPRRHPAGDVPGSRTHSATVREYDDGVLTDDGCAWRSVSLDAGEMFGQLCCATNLVKLAPRRNVMVSIVEVGDGLIRVFRDWLAERAGADMHGGDMHGRKHDAGVLWVNNGNKDVGIKFRVRERRRRDNPILYANDEEVAVSYFLDIQELLIRTSFLLHKIERSREQQEQELGQGKAIIFGSFPDAT